MKTVLKAILACSLYAGYVVVVSALSLLAGYRRRKARRMTGWKPSLLWGSTPLINNKYWSLAMRQEGYRSETFVTHYYAIHQRSDWDRVLQEEFTWCSSPLKVFVAFVDVLFCYDIVFTSFDGVFLGNTRVWRLQGMWLRWAEIPVVVVPYGGDSYVYRNVRSTLLLHGLMASYPAAGKRQAAIGRRLDYWCERAVAVIPGFMGADGFGRYDVLMPSQLFVDLELWRASRRPQTADGRNGQVVIGHAPNHRGFKGTEFVIQAVERLRSEGLDVQLRLLERLPNEQVRAILGGEIDILVEQLLFIGHGLNGVEGMASGIPVVANLSDPAYLEPYRHWSFLDECPIVSATPDTITQVLRRLVCDPQLRARLGSASRQYAVKFHGLDSAGYLFNSVIQFVEGRRESLIDLYHPLTSPWVRRQPRVEHPLVRSCLPS